MAQHVNVFLENERGEAEQLYPSNTSDDVLVGKLSNGELTLPGETYDEMLSTTLQNIRKCLSNLELVAAKDRQVVDVIGAGANDDIPSVKSLDELMDSLQTLNLSVNHLLEAIELKADISHADSDGSNGIGSATKYGHVKVLSDLTEVEDPTGWALGYGVEKSLLEKIGKKADASHVSTTGENGVADTTLYGHVKLSNEYGDTLEEDGLAASQQALHEVYENLGDRLIAVETGLNTKGEANHANADKSMIGGATENLYGHVKLSDSYETSDGNAVQSVGASSEALCNAYKDLLSKIEEINKKLDATASDG